MQDVLHNTYNSVPAVHIITTAVAHSARAKSWKLMQWALSRVDLDSGIGVNGVPASSHHHCILKFNGAGHAEKKKTLERNRKNFHEKHRIKHI